MYISFLDNLLVDSSSSDESENICDDDIEVTRVVVPKSVLQQSKSVAGNILTDCNSSTDSECGSNVNQFVTLPANKNDEKSKNVVDAILLDTSEYDSDVEVLNSVLEKTSNDFNGKIYFCVNLNYLQCNICVNCN
jgi:hypothetical protein